MLFLPTARKDLLTQHPDKLTAKLLKGLDVLLVMVAQADASRLLKTMPEFAATGRNFLATDRKVGDIFEATADFESQLRIIVGLLPENASEFQRLTLAARLVKRAGQLSPTHLGLWAGPNGSQDCGALLAAVLAATESQPSAKSKPSPAWVPTEVRVFAAGSLITRVAAMESGAHLARFLTALPANALTPKSYTKRIQKLAAEHGWKVKVYSEADLAKLGAGAFLAVCRGSDTRDAAIVEVQYKPKRKGARQKPIALVGKGICFDTGGSNLKSAGSMQDMHTDMAGSAVALGVLTALTELQYEHPVTLWLALSENRISARSYLQSEVVTASNGVTIQVAHTDAEGRMVLADTLALAARAQPAAIIDFATLTGACVSALTERMSGLFTNRPALRDTLERAGHRSGERVHVFPSPTDFDEDLDSPVADVTQCLIHGKGDHIYAARFLNHFVPDTIPWAHLDLSSATRKGGLAHAPHEITGFGVRYCTTLLLDDHTALRGGESL